MKKAWNKPLPVVDEDYRPFWDALKRHEFRLFHCKVCGAWYWPIAFCRNHDNEPFYGNLEWARASGKGKVNAVTIHHRAFHPGFAEDIPYVYALVELEEGPIISSTVVGRDIQAAKIGMPVEVVFDDITEEFTLPRFRLTK